MLRPSSNAHCISIQGSMNKQKGWRGRYRKTEINGCHLQNIGHIDLLIHVHILEVHCVHICVQDVRFL